MRLKGRYGPIIRDLRQILARGAWEGNAFSAICGARAPLLSYAEISRDLR